MVSVAEGKIAQPSNLFGCSRSFVLTALCTFTPSVRASIKNVHSLFKCYLLTSILVNREELMEA